MSDPNQNPGSTGRRGRKRRAQNLSKANPSIPIPPSTASSSSASGTGAEAGRRLDLLEQANAGPRLGALEGLKVRERLADLDALGKKAKEKIYTLQNSVGKLDTSKSKANVEIKALQNSVGKLNTFQNQTDGESKSLQDSVGKLNTFQENTGEQLNNLRSSLDGLRGSTQTRVTALENTNPAVRLEALESSRDAFDTFKGTANGRLTTLENLNAGARLGLLDTFQGNANGRLNALENVRPGVRLEALEASRDGFENFQGNANERLNDLEGLQVRAGERLSILEALKPGERLVTLYNFKENASGRLNTLENVNAGTRLNTLEDLRAGERLNELHAFRQDATGRLKDLETFQQAAIPMITAAKASNSKANDRLDALEAGKVPLRDYQIERAEMNGRINAIQTMTENLRDAHQTEIPQLKTRMTDAEKRVKGLDGDVTQIQAQIHKNHDELTKRMDKQEKDLSSGIKSLQDGQEACCKTVKGMFEKLDDRFNKNNGQNEMKDPSGGGNTPGAVAMAPYAQSGAGINFNTIGSNWFHPSFYNGNSPTSSYTSSEPPSIISVRPARRAKYLVRAASLSPSPPPSSLSRRHRSPHGNYHGRSHSSNGTYANYNAPSIQIGLQRGQGHGLFSKAKKDNVHIAVGGGRGAGGAGESRRRGSWIRF